MSIKAIIQYVRDAIKELHGIHKELEQLNKTVKYLETYGLNVHVQDTGDEDDLK